MIAFEIKSDSFSGPLTKLLELIEEKKLEVTAISLGEVTADFLKYLGDLEEGKHRPNFLADFIAIASRLILIKSKALLPNLELTTDEEAEIKDLEERLRIYKEFTLAKVGVRNLWGGGIKSFERKFLPIAFFSPPENLKIEDLRNTMVKLSQSFQLAPETESVKIDLLNFEDKLKELALRLKKEFKASFGELSRDKDRQEIVVLFLAILHLLKDNLISITQEKQFSDIVITSKEKHG